MTQVELHPSPLIVLPSSQSVAGLLGTLILPFPQISVQIEPLTLFVHWNPDSTMQAELHPSPFVRLPSSHVSEPSVTPSPQEAEE